MVQVLVFNCFIWLLFWQLVKSWVCFDQNEGYWKVQRPVENYILTRCLDLNDVRNVGHIFNLTVFILALCQYVLTRIKSLNTLTMKVCMEKEPYII